MPLIAALILAAGLAHAANDSAKPSPVTVTGKVVALKDLSGQVTAVKLLGHDGNIYDITLDDTAKALARQARLIVRVTGTATEKQPAGEKPAVWQLTVQTFELDNPNPGQPGRRAPR
jgi:hypothetical protein